MNKLVKWGLILVMVLLLVLIRAYQGTLFYDPLLEFFKTTHSTASLPDLEVGKLMLNTGLRFVLNTFISLMVLWLLFRENDIIKLAAFLYSLLFLVLMVAFYLLLGSEQEGGHMALFYVRRFLIQPILLLLLIPAFYFQKKR